MSWFGSFYRSAIGKKAVMAATGIILFGFVLAHMAGNLKLYLGAEAINHYGEWLRRIGEPALPHGVALWIARFVLLAAVVLHIDAATRLTIMNRRARPVGYKKLDNVADRYAARTMRWGGVIILLFVIYHLLHLTFGTAHPDFIEGDVYHNFVVGFSVWWVSAFYIIANLALGLHLYHGLWSLFQSMGWNHPRFNSWRRIFATVFAVVVTLGNISFPLAVLSGAVR
jgi:succinate dehydrogenase / fumarate reductase cytochrome b subunit